MLVLAYPDNNPNKEIIYENDTINVRAINAKVLAKKKCCGYCSNDIHPGYLDKKLMKVHDCQNKECVFLYQIVNPARKSEATNTGAFDDVCNKLLQKDAEIIFKIKEYHQECLGIRNVRCITICQKYEVEYAHPFSLDENKLQKALEEFSGVEILLKKSDFRYF